MTISKRSQQGLSPAARQKGFTLIEVLLATSILVFMVVLLGTITSSVSQTWTTVNVQNQRRATGRALLQFMAKEIKMARLPNPSGPGVSIEHIRLIANQTSPTALIPVECLNPHALYWQAPVESDPSKGTIAEIGYFVHWSAAPAKATLYRYFANPAANATYSGTNWATKAVATDLNSPYNTSWLADNVIALFVRCLDASGAPITKMGNSAGTNYPTCSFDSQTGYTDPTTGYIHPGPVLPPAVEITIVVVDDNTAKRIAAPIPAPAYSPATLSADIQTFVNGLNPTIKSGAEVFSTTVFLQPTN